MTRAACLVDSPVGNLLLVSEGTALRNLCFHDDWSQSIEFLRREFGEARVIRDAVPSSIVDAVRSYFDGDVACLDALQVLTRGTEFQVSVWRALRELKAGDTCSYGELARRLSNPGAVRAVGAANGRNPIPIVIPCHRVIASDGSLHGYGGGLHRKRWLLQHETRQHSLFV